MICLPYSGLFLILQSRGVEKVCETDPQESSQAKRLREALVSWRLIKSNSLF